MTRHELGRGDTGRYTGRPLRTLQHKCYFQELRTLNSGRHAKIRFYDPVCDVRRYMDSDGSSWKHHAISSNLLPISHTTRTTYSIFNKMTFDSPVRASLKLSNLDAAPRSQEQDIHCRPRTQQSLLPVSDSLLRDSIKVCGRKCVLEWV